VQSRENRKQAVKRSASFENDTVEPGLKLGCESQRNTHVTFLIGYLDLTKPTVINDSEDGQLFFAPKRRNAKS